MDVRRTPGVRTVRPRIGAGLDGDELVMTLRVGHHAAGAREVRIERRGMLVVDMGVAAAGVGLPDFDERIGHTAAILVDHAAVHDDALAERITRMLARQVAVALADGFMSVNRTG